jgi:hypothetical protein
MPTYGIHKIILSYLCHGRKNTRPRNKLDWPKAKESQLVFGLNSHGEKEKGKEELQRRKIQ